MNLDLFCLIRLLPSPGLTRPDSGQDSSSPSTTPHTRDYSSSSSTPHTRAPPLTPTPQGPPNLPLALPSHGLAQPPRVPPTPPSHAPQLGPPFPLSTLDILAQGLTSVPPPASAHTTALSGLHPNQPQQNPAAPIKVSPWLELRRTQNLCLRL